MSGNRTRLFGRGKQRSRRATAILQTAVFGSLVGVGAMALTVDTGMQFNTRGELQNAADAAALAAALELGGSADAQASARQQAAAVAAQNKVRGSSAYVDPNVDVEFGHAVLDGARYVYQPNVQPFDAVKVTVRRDGSDANHPKVPLMFGAAIFSGGASISASAIGMLVPRDIALVIDLSGSMNDDSELRHYRQFQSETPPYANRPGVQIDLEDVWLSIACTKGGNGVGNGTDPASPGAATANNNQPATGSGKPNSVGGNPSPGASTESVVGSCGGPRWGWMTGFGNEIILGAYTPVSDPGLYYIPRSATCTDADVIANLTEAGYSSAERSALLSGQYDTSFTTYTARVKVLLGLAGWKSKKTGGKYTGGTGNGDNKVDSGEVAQQVSWPFGGGSWDDWINYASSTSSEHYQTDSNFRYRYGIKTVVNYLLEKQASHSKCPELAAAPEEPIGSAKHAVQAMIDLIVSLDTQDHCSLEVFATTGRHEVNLTVPSGGQSLATLLHNIPATLYQRQAGHYDSTTNIGAGFQMAYNELTSSRVRPAASKVCILLTDGKPNVSDSGHLSPSDYAVDRAQAVANQNVTIYTIGLGADVDPQLLGHIAEIGKGEYFYADSAPDATGQPAYVTQLQTIFQQLGGKRPVRLIK
ncbi:MAG: vWA domain-containing protein [Phycisphaerae bacterium]